MCDGRSSVLQMQKRRDVEIVREVDVDLLVLFFPVTAALLNRHAISISFRPIEPIGISLCTVSRE